MKAFALAWTMLLASTAAAAFLARPEIAIASAVMASVAAYAAGRGGRR